MKHSSQCCYTFVVGVCYVGIHIVLCLSSWGKKWHWKQLIPSIPQFLGCVLVLDYHKILTSFTMHTDLPKRLWCKFESQVLNLSGISHSTCKHRLSCFNSSETFNILLNESHSQHALSQPYRGSSAWMFGVVPLVSYCFILVAFRQALPSVLWRSKLRNTYCTLDFARDWRRISWCKI